MDGLTRAAEGYLDGYLNVEDITGEDFAAGAKAILDTGSKELRGILRRAVKSGVLLLAVAMLCGMVGSVQAELGGGGLDPVRLAGTAAVTAIAVADVHSRWSTPMWLPWPPMRPWETTGSSGWRVLSNGPAQGFSP